MGRKATPTAIKKTMGNPSKRSLNEDEPEIVVAGWKDAPDHVKKQEYAEEIWIRTLRILIDMGVISEGDMDALATYCIALAVHRDASLMLADEQLLYESTTESGGIIMRKSPYIEIINQQARIAQSFAAEFGLTPASRSKVKVNGKKESSPLAEFMH